MGRLSPNVSGRLTIIVPMAADTYRYLRLVNGYNCGECANSKTRDDPTNHHHRHSCRQCLESAADKKDNRAVENRFAAPNQIAYPTYKQWRNQGPDLKNCNHRTNRSPWWLVKIILEIPTSIDLLEGGSGLLILPEGDWRYDSGHNTLIIAEEKDT